MINSAAIIDIFNDMLPQNVAHHHHADARQKIRKLEAFVLPDAVPRQLWIKIRSHLRSPPAVSMVRVSEII